MVNDKYLGKAKNLENFADELTRKPKKDYKRIRETYIGAGEEYESGQDIRKAHQMYEQALKYADVDEIGIIKEKISNLGTQRMNIQDVLSGKRTFFQPKFKKKIFAILSISSLVFALIFTSFSLTGNSIGGLEEVSSRWIGLCLFICGLFFAFFYFRRKDKKI